MEFLRFGSSIPGSYWGCCACCIIQNFKVDPDAKASIQLVDGDGGNPITNDDGFMFAGPTWKDIFLQRLRYGTFGARDMPNHAFFAILTEWQVNSGVGKKWLKILKEQGFEFLRTVDNSVYSGASVINKPGQGCTSGHPNHIFALIRNVGEGAIKDPFTPPKAWTDLDPVVPEFWMEFQGDGKEFNAVVQEAQLPLYNALPKDQFLSEKELIEQKVPIIYAGLRSRYPQQSKGDRESLTKLDKNMTNKATATASDPFAPVAASA